MRETGKTGGDGNHRMARAVIYGTGTTVLVLTVLMAIGGLVGWLGFTWSSYPSVIEAGLVWTTLSAILAYGSGGWIAGRIYRGEVLSITPGLLTGIVTIIVMTAGLIILTNRYGDVRSIGIELGLIDIPDTDPIDVPSFDAEGDPIIISSERAYIVLIETGLYLLGTAGLLLSASVLGALAAQFGSLEAS